MQPLLGSEGKSRRKKDHFGKRTFQGIWGLVPSSGYSNLFLGYNSTLTSGSACNSNAELPISAMTSGVFPFVISKAPDGTAESLLIGEWPGGSAWTGPTIAMARI